MFFITMAEKGGDTQELLFEKDEVTIGRVAGNDIVLNKGNVSKYHTQLVLKDGKFIVVDLKSTNGTFVNGKKIAAPQVVKPTDKIYIGDYILNVDAPPEDMEAQGDEEHAEEGEGEYEDEPAEEGGEEEYEDEPAEDEEAHDEEPPPEDEHKNMPASLANAMRRRDKHVDPKVEAYANLQKDIHDRLIEYLDLRRLDMDRLGDEELWRRTEKAIRDILAQMDADGEIPEEVDQRDVAGRRAERGAGPGPARGLPG